ncbi:diaminopimelate epimerase [Sulfurimonas sp. HSL-1716]|uniref:diaminopimelate epimerase n=1 Tax=Hydrocurvibacter sulfurireducens TaxID=3131937 RepID=UPI0031F80054
MNVTKYSANGNDFVIFHTFLKKDRSALAKEICDRQNGVGADGLIVLIPHETYDFEWEFYNSDGSTAEMCGNGSRACAHYAFTNGLAPASMRFLTQAGVIGAEVNGTLVTSELTPPNILDKEIVENKKSWWKIDTGVPHLITFDADIENFDIKEARELRYKYNANVNIAAVKENGLYVRTYERGVEDETLACGTGMASAFYRAYQESLVADNTKVFPKSGDTLYLAAKGDTITFAGEVKAVFTTDYNV